MCRTTFETLCEKLQNLFGMKLIIELTLLYLSALDNDIFVYFYVTSTDYGINWINIYLPFSDRFATTIKVNIKQVFMGNDVFLKIFI